MPVNYCQSIGLCRKAKETVENVSKKSNFYTKRYGIFIVLILEVLSVFIAKQLGVHFVDFWYGFLANNTILLLVYKNFCDRKELKYCQRTIIGLKFLITYFLLNSFVMLFNSFSDYYYQTVSYLLLLCCFLTIGISLLIKYKK